MDGAVDQIVEMGFSREDAEFALKSNNNVNRAIEYIFSGKIDEDRAKNEWSESQFTQPNWAPPEPYLNPNEINAFDPATFYSEEENKSSGVTNWPTTRTVEKVPEHSSGVDRDEEMDDDIAKAMRMSLEDISHANVEQYHSAIDRSGLESGVLFGPATQDHYDSSQWGMMSLRDQPTMLHDYDIESARREPNLPPVLRPCDRRKNLAPFLMILHSIPLARVALLFAGKKLVDDYGIVSKWWDREILFIPDFARSTLKQEEIQRILLLIECQRIMAFLDTTSPSERSYCSIENLDYALNSIQQTYMGLSHYEFMLEDDPVTTFMQSWSLAASEYAPRFEAPEIVSLSETLFNTQAAIDRSADDETEASNVASFASIDIVVADNVRTVYNSLVGILDNLLWSDDPDGQENGLSGCGFDLPLEWYPDRYTLKFRSAMKANNQRRVDVLDEIESLRERKHKIQKYSAYDTSSLLDSTVTYYTSKDPSHPTLAKLRTLTANLDDYIARIDRKIAFLEQEVRDLTEFLSEPPEKDDAEGQASLKAAFGDEESPQFTKYLLAGVVISDSMAYFRQRRVKEKANILDKQEDEEQDAMEFVWYHYAYYGGIIAGSFEVKEVNAEQVVMSAATAGADGIIAVYAKEDAYANDEFVQGFVNSGLKDFLIKDNELLKDELQDSGDAVDLITLDNSAGTPIASSSSSFSFSFAGEESEPEMVALSSQMPSEIPVHSDETMTSPRALKTFDKAPTENPGAETVQKVPLANDSVQKVTVKHAEHGEDEEMSDSDEDMLKQMRKK